VSEWVVEGLETDLDHFHLGPVDLRLPPGSAVAVLGTSGAGKTTLLRTLAGFLRTRPGRVLRDGVDVTGWPPEARGLGYVPQGLGLFPHRTVEENVAYPLEIRGRPETARRTRELLERFHLTALARRRPARLSGGEQQRVAIARALAAEPGLIIWDEPWQALDVVARYDLHLVLHDLRETERVPIVVVTHDPGLAFSVADTFLVLESGHVRVHCDAVTLMRTPADAFAARFVGYENVYEREALDAARASPFGAWLREQAGPGGIALSTPDLAGPGGTAGTWEGVVRSARPGPQGVAVEVMCGTLLVRLRVPPPVSPPFPSVGQTVRFALPPESIHPLGASAEAR
jgi:putative spermidine/putrescine transport system ATP-binding protein